MNLQHLRYFAESAKHKSFSSASKSLHVSQPAISKSISLLEGSLNIQLFERNYHGIKLTDKGALLYESIAPILDQLDHAISEVTEKKEYRIGTLPSIASYYLPNQLSKLSLCTFYTITHVYSQHILTMLYSGEIDAAIIQMKEVPAKLKCLKLIDDPYLVAMRNDHPLAHQEPLHLADLMEHPMILHKAPCDIRDDIVEMCTQHNLLMNVALQSPIESVIGYTMSGLGFSFVPAMVASQVSHSNVVYKSITDHSPGRQIVLVTRSSQIIQLFRSIL